MLIMVDLCYNAKQSQLRLLIDLLTLLSENQYTSYDIEENTSEQTVQYSCSSHNSVTNAMDSHSANPDFILTVTHKSHLRCQKRYTTGSRKPPRNIFVLSICINVVVQIFVCMIF